MALIVKGLSKKYEAQLAVDDLSFTIEKGSVVGFLGPNGAGKTTFAENFLPEEAECLNFLNADLIARGIAPFNPEKVALESGKLFLKRMDTIFSNKESFAFETTLSGLNYIDRIKKWKQAGYEIILYFLKLPSEGMALKRVQTRVSEGGHNVPEDVIIRRFHRGWFGSKGCRRWWVGRRVLRGRM